MKRIASPRLARLAVAGFLILTAVTPGLLVYAETTTTEAGAGPEAKPNKVLVAILNDEIVNPVTARFVAQAIEKAEEENIPLILQLDTPGGLLQATREIVKSIYASRVPVITYVYPAGSRAASAGVFITMASHVAAMSPQSHIGAAHPVGVDGTFPTRRKRDLASTITQQSERKLEDAIKSADELDSGGNPMGDKVMNDTLAWAESIAKSRNRNAEWARMAVEDSISTIAAGALELNVVDLVAADVDELVDAIHGLEVEVAGGAIYVLNTQGATIREIEMNTGQRVLNMLANPNVALLLLLIGIAAIIYEVTHFGLVVPGIVGVVCLMLAALSLGMLPTNYLAVFLILLGIGLIVAEISFTSYGLLTIAGATCLLFGSLTLVDSPDGFTGVSLMLVIPLVTTIVLFLSLLVFLVVRSHSRKPVLGNDSLIGQIADVAVPLAPNGKVFFNGAYWDAVSETAIERGQRVRVIGIDKLKLFVEPE